MDIWTIGHSNVPAARIIELLQGHDITDLVDVRSYPASRFNPQFNRKALAQTLAEAGIQYHYMGDTLGGRPSDPACYRVTEQGESRVDYQRVMAQPWYQQGIDALIALASQVHTAIMCSEGSWRHCHRQHLLAQTLLERGALVWHILPDGGSVAAESDINQLKLF